MRAISCSSITACIAVGNAGDIITTANGGASWTTRTSGVTGNLYGMTCASATVCWAVGDYGTIVATTDGGATRSVQNGGVNTVGALTCLTTTICTAVGVNGTIITTANGGTTWTAQSSGTTTNLDSISCITASRCVVVGLSGVILVTGDGGATWSPEPSGTANRLNPVYCANSSFCIAVGASGTVLSGSIPSLSYTPFQVIVTGSILSLSSPASLSAGTVTLNGSAQTITSTLPVTVTDARGTGVGWALSLSAADPQSVSSATIPFTNLALAPQTPVLVDSSGAPVSGLSVGSSGSLSGTDTTPGTPPSSAYALLTAPSSNGMGMYTQNQSLGLTVPASAATGVYTTSLVLAVQ